MPSIHADVSAKCPSCGEEFDAQAWSFVRGDENDDLRLALMYGEFNLLRCEKCDAFFHHEMPVVYFDPAAELLIADICRLKGWTPIYAQREMVKLEVAGKWQRRPVRSPQTRKRADAWRPVKPA